MLDRNNEFFPTLLGNSESPLELFLQVMCTKTCCVCVIFPRNRPGCHYPHTHQTQGSGFNYPLLSLSLYKISFEVFWLCSASHCFCLCDQKKTRFGNSTSWPDNLAYYWRRQRESRLLTICVSLCVPHCDCEAVNFILTDDFLPWASQHVHKPPLFSFIWRLCFFFSRLHVTTRH